MSLARADLEALLRARKLDRTLTTHASRASSAFVWRSLMNTPRRRPVLRRWTRGWAAGFRAARSRRSSARDRRAARACCCRCSPRPPRARELVALVDVLDMLDVASADAAGVDLARLLWVRGQVVPNPGLCRELNQRALDQPIKALTLVLQAGNFGLVVFDAAEAPPHSAPAIAVHDVAAAAAHHRREPDGLRARRRRADGAQLGGIRCG